MKYHCSMYAFIAPLVLIASLAGAWMWFSFSTVLPYEEVLKMDRIAVDRVMLGGRWYDLPVSAGLYLGMPGQEASEPMNSWKMPPLGQGYIWVAVTPEILARTHWGRTVIVRFHDSGKGMQVAGIYAPPSTATTTALVSNAGNP